MGPSAVGEGGSLAADATGAGGWAASIWKGPDSASTGLGRAFCKRLETYFRREYSEMGSGDGTPASEGSEGVQLHSFLRWEAQAE